MSTAIQFKKAVKYEAKGRVAIIGPSGAGKSYTMLTLARLLAGAEGKIAAIDTEHGSLSKYSDLFDFDVIEPDLYTPDAFTGALAAAESGGYAVFCCDSLSHFWMGAGGALEFVDNASKRSSSRDGMAGWKDFSPVERRMIDAMIGSTCHVIVTMRTKNEYVEEVNERGKKVRRKIGLAPVQRQGMEYEFDLVGLMDEDNTFIVDKTRCPVYQGKALTKPGVKEFKPFADWLLGAERLPAAPRPVIVPPPAPKSRAEGVADAQAVAAKKIEDMNAALHVTDADTDPGPSPTWIKDMMPAFAEMKEKLGEPQYRAILTGAKYANKNALMKAGRTEASRVFKIMVGKLKYLKVRAGDLEELAEMRAAKEEAFEIWLAAGCSTTWDDLQQASGEEITKVLAAARERK